MGTVLADFTHIMGDGPVSVPTTDGDNVAGGGTEATAFKAANNEFAIKNVSDDFQIKSIICFFHQES
jgi:hypothetical protein